MNAPRTPDPLQRRLAVFWMLFGLACAAVPLLRPSWRGPQALTLLGAACVVCLVAGWGYFHGRPWGWSAMALAMVGTAYYGQDLLVGNLLGGRFPRSSWVALVVLAAAIVTATHLVSRRTRREAWPAPRDERSPSDRGEPPGGSFLHRVTRPPP